MKDLAKESLRLYKKAKKATKEYYDFQMKHFWTNRVSLAYIQLFTSRGISLLSEEKEKVLGVMNLEDLKTGIYRYYNKDLGGLIAIYIGMSEVELFKRTISFISEIIRCFEHYKTYKNFDIKLSESHSKKFVMLCIEKGLDPISELENTYVQYCPCNSDFSLDFEKLSITEFRDHNDGEAPILNVMR